MLESGVQKACDEFLELDGWRTVKTDLPHLRGLGVQEKGMADRLYMRYLKPIQTLDECLVMAAEVVWIEWKRIRHGRKGATKKSEDQGRWHYIERCRGGLTLIAGEDFPATVEGFCEWYRKSGMMRRNLKVGGAA